MLAVECIREALFAPVSIEHFWVVRVFMHFKIIINNLHSSIFNSRAVKLVCND